MEEEFQIGDLIAIKCDFPIRASWTFTAEVIELDDQRQPLQVKIIDVPEQLATVDSTITIVNRVKSGKIVNVSDIELIGTLTFSLIRRLILS